MSTQTEEKKSEPTSLADAADSAMSEIGSEDGAAQQMLDGTAYTKVKFVGMSFDSLEHDQKIGDEVIFVVRGRVKGIADEEDAKGNVQHVAKVKVSSVVPHEESPTHV